MATLTIEDGSIVSDANSYVTEAEFVSYAGDRGSAPDSSDSDATRESLIKAADYLDTQAERLRTIDCYRRDRTQPMSFPRFNLFIDGWNVNNDEIPRIVKDCQCELTMDLLAGIDIRNRAFYQANKKVKAGSVEITYATKDHEQRVLKSSSQELLGRILYGVGYQLMPSFAAGRHTVFGRF